AQRAAYLRAERAARVGRRQVPVHGPRDAEVGAAHHDLHRQVIPDAFLDGGLQRDRGQCHALARLGVHGDELQAVRVAGVVDDQGEPLVTRRVVEQREQTRPLQIVELLEHDVCAQADAAERRGPGPGAIGVVDRDPCVAAWTGYPGEVDRLMARAALVRPRVDLGRASDTAEVAYL